jgi:hypothetical protein
MLRLVKKGIAGQKACDDMRNGKFVSEAERQSFISTVEELKERVKELKLFL